MLRIVLTLLLGLPMLLPPGVCICQFSPFAQAIETPTVTVPDTRLCGSCGCSKRHANKSQPNELVAAAPTDGHGGRNHTLGCPVLNPAVSKAALPTIESPDELVCESIRLILAYAIEPPCRDLMKVVPPPVAPPLLVIQCSFQI